MMEQLPRLITGRQGPQVAASDWRGWAESGLRDIKGQGEGGNNRGGEREGSEEEETENRAA